jgi:GGDEF domain-containing protein
MLPTLESELEWIDAHDLQTGMLNRQAAYHYIESEVKSLPNVGSVGAIFLFRFGETVFSSSQAEQAYLKLLSTFSVDVKKLSQISHVQLARMDKNEVAVFVRVNQSQTLQVLDSSLLEMLQNMARRFELDLGNVSSSFTQLGENTYPPHTVFQALQSKL